MSPVEVPDDRSRVSAPRASGDEPETIPGVAHTYRVRPARAGMSPDTDAAARSKVCAPRASGDEPASSTVLVAISGCAPRERG